MTLIFDDIDTLQDENIIYNLSREGGFEELNEKQYIHIIGISNADQFISFLYPKITSFFQQNTISFPPYNENQIIAILENRVSLAFCPKVVDKKNHKIMRSVSRK